LNGLILVKMNVGEEIGKVELKAGQCWSVSSEEM
jgi:hypothetical protein